MEVISLRTLAAVWWLFALIISTTYSANLVAFLAVEKSTVPFKTLHDLSIQTEYKFGTLGASVWSQLFEVDHSFSYYEATSKHLYH